jgi:hypothetical protein
MRDVRKVGFAAAGFGRNTPEQAQALDRVRGFTRARFALPEDATVVVAEVACGVPGCPPIETVVAFWTAPDKRHHLKFFKRAETVTLDDFPPAWLRDSLAVSDEAGWDCC